MVKSEFRREKQKILTYILVYGFACELISLLILGFDGKFLSGLIAGICAVMLNLFALEKVVDYLIAGKKTGLAFLLHFGRLLFFGLIGYLCFKIGFTALIAYGFGVIGLTVAAVATYVRKS